MALKIRTAYTTGSSLKYSVERMSDATYFDFSDSTFKSSPTTLLASLTEGSGSLVGRYSATISSTPTGQWSDGDYTLSIHDASASNAVLAVGAFVMRDGSDATFLAPKVADIWTTTLTESYAADGATASGAQLLYACFARLFNWTLSGTTFSAKKLDKSTTALTSIADSVDDTSSFIRGS